MSEPLCKICNHPKSDHPFQHVFSEDGKLKEKEKPKATPRPQMAIDPIALRLAAKLHQKGILTESELSEVVRGVPSDGDQKTQHP